MLIGTQICFAPEGRGLMEKEAAAPTSQTKAAKSALSSNTDGHLWHKIKGGGGRVVSKGTKWSP